MADRLDHENGHENGLEALCKTLAEPVGRRQALRRLGGGLAGALLASIGLGRAASAQGGGNSACAKFCNDVFPPGPQRGKCKSDAARGQGLCY